MDAGIHVANLNAWFGTKQALFDIGWRFPRARPRPSLGLPAAENLLLYAASIACMKRCPTTRGKAKFPLEI